MREKFIKGHKLIATSRQYLDYLERHFNFIERAWSIFKERCGDMEFLEDDYVFVGIESALRTHDLSKLSKSEFIQYRDYFYQNPFLPSYQINEDMKSAWESHKLINEHHWENWAKATYNYHNDWIIDCVHMLIDWMAMGFEKGDNAKIFYEKNKENIELPDYAVKLLYEMFDRLYPEGEE